MRLRLLRFSFFLFACSILSGCGGCQSNAIEGRIASDRDFRRANSALEQRQNALSLDGISVDLLSVEGSGDPDAWPVVETVVPNTDGSFSFTGVASGTYALRLNQPEFGGSYGIDATEFTLDGGQTVSLILPLLSNFQFSGPGVGAWNAAALDRETGLVYGGGSGGFWVLNPEPGNESLNVLYSDVLFDHQVAYDAHVVTVAHQRQQAVIVYRNRIIRIDLDIFDNADENQALNFDDPHVRQTLGDKVRWRFIPAAMVTPIAENNVLRSFYSADESVLYVSLSNSWNREEHVPGEGRVMVIDVETLQLRRIITGEALAYHKHTDQLVFYHNMGVVLVDASSMRDAGSANASASLGVAPVPGSNEYVLLSSMISSDDKEIPFVTVIDNTGAILMEQQRAREYLGINHDPDPGAPSFDADGNYFMIGAQGFRVRDDGSFEDVGVQVPPGRYFMERVDCNQQRVFDPIHRYEVWHGCLLEGLNIPMAILSADRNNIPISVRINSENVLLHPEKGRALVFGMGFDLTTIHYADAEASTYPASRTLNVGEESPRQVCSATEPCPQHEICRGESDTAWTGYCFENPRTPYLAYCGGMTNISCDDGFRCELLNPSNPESIGTCTGQPNRDYENHGPLCESDGSCPTGMNCGTTNRCIPAKCTFDEDCNDSEICGLVAMLGRVCMAPGSVANGDLCQAPGDCIQGACIDTGLARGPDLTLDPTRPAPPFMLCTQPCVQNSDCPDTAQCRANLAPWPVCVESEWLIGTQDHAGVGTIESCEPRCADHELCAGNQCQVGFALPLLNKPADHLPQECQVDVDCASPARCVGDDHGLRQCALACNRKQDCLWDVDCVAGVCPVAASGWPHNAQQFYCNDGTGCADHELCTGFWMSIGENQNPHFCFDHDPCYSDDECPSDYHCEGICTRSCQPEEGITPEVCMNDQQCVVSTTQGWAPHYCLPPLCDCPDSGTNKTYCALDTGRCHFPAMCTNYACDGTFGPQNPDPEVDETCCAPGNPCNLTAHEICDCPPSCDFWNTEYCICNDPENCPTPGQISACPENYHCLHDHQHLYGSMCVQQQ